MRSNYEFIRYCIPV